MYEEQGKIFDDEDELQSNSKKRKRNEPKKAETPKKSRQMKIIDKVDKKGIPKITSFFQKV